MAESQSENASRGFSRKVTFYEAMRFWLKLGFISFGGPAGQIAIMHRELVERRHWISEKRFLHALNYCMVLPGPEAQQLATYIGWLLHGTLGGIVAGGLFVLPSFFILMGLSAVYIEYGDVPVIAAIFEGIKPAVVAIVVSALVRIGGRAIRNTVTLGIAVMAFVGLAILHLPFPLIILGAGLLGLVGSRVWPDKFVIVSGHATKKSSDAPTVPAMLDDDHAPPAHARPSWQRVAWLCLIGAVLWGGPICALVAAQGITGTHSRMGFFFSVAALVTFGGAYAVLPYVAHQTVEVYGWLKPEQMIDGLALGETTPGPLIMVVAFVGFVAGFQATELGWTGAVLGAVVATYFTFLPSFLFIFIGAPYIEQMRGELRLTAALSGITAAVVGVIFNLALVFARTTFCSDVHFSNPIDWSAVISQVDWIGVLIAVAAFVALSRFKLNFLFVILACAVCGLVRLAVGIA